MQLLALLSVLPLLASAVAEAEPYNPFFPVTFHRPTGASDKRHVRQFDSQFLKEAHAATQHDAFNVEPIRKRQIPRAELEHAGDFLRQAQEATRHHGVNVEPVRRVERRQDAVAEEARAAFLREALAATHHDDYNVEPKRDVQTKRKVARKVKKRAGTCPTKSATTESTSTIGGGLIAHPSSSTAAPTTTAAPTATAAPTTSAAPTTTAAKPTTTQYTVDPYGNGPFSGWGTWFDVGLNACGTYDTPGMPVVAISAELFDQWPGYDGTNPNNNPICGLHLDITWGGKTLTVEATDRCPGCAVRSLDLSKGAFEYFADLGVGLLGMDDYTGNITWSWTSGTGRLPQLPYTP